MSSKRNIKSFGATYQYLKDPDLRRKEAGDALLAVDSAEISGVSFQALSWRKIKFTNCDFVGGYEIKLSELQDCIFENCRFAGIISWGVAKNIAFLRCQAASGSNVLDFSGSSDVRFDSCHFAGTDADPNHWGAMGSRGDATFTNCTAKWFALVGYKKLTLANCEVAEVEVGVDSKANSSSGFASSVVLIERSKLRGIFDMRAADLQSLTIRDTQLDVLDLNNAMVRGDILMERVKGGYANVYVKEARSLTVRDSQFYGNGGKFFEAYAGGIRAIEIDNVTFGGDLTSEPVTIAGGTGADLSNVRSRVNDSIIMRKSKVPRLSTHHVNTALYQLQDCEIGSLDLSSSRIDQLEITGNTIARSVDFSNTQAKESKVQSLAKGQAKIEGSNIKLPR